VAPEELPSEVVAELKLAVEPLLEIGFQFEVTRKESRGIADSWQAMLSSAQGMVWAVVESREESSGAGMTVSLLSFTTEGAVAKTVAGAAGLSLPGSPRDDGWERRASFDSALAQSEAHAALLQENEVAVVALTCDEFLQEVESRGHREVEALFEKGWLKESPGSNELRLTGAKLPLAACCFLKNKLANRASMPWWGTAENAPGTAAIPDAIPDEESAASAGAMGEAVEESGDEIPGEDSWERDLARYEKESAHKSWLYWLRGHGPAALFFLSLEGIVIWLVASGNWSGRFAAFVALAFLIHELGHVALMAARRKWDWSFLLVPIPRPLSAREWPTEGGRGELLTLLAGPVPGLLFGWSTMAIAFWGGPIPAAMLDFALASIVVNSFLMLPFRPLDGGRLLDLLVFRKLPGLRVVGLALGGVFVLATFFAGAGVLAIVGFTSLLMYNFGNSISAYTTFETATEIEGNVHVVGKWVKEKPSGFSDKSMQFSFFMEDESGNMMRVMYPKPKPNNFDQATQLVVIGKMKNGVFYANDMLMKCPSKYNDANMADFEPAEHNT
jgi:cytochrome c-type biogenesis protein CcmE